MLSTHVLLGGVHEEHLELVEAVVDSLASLLLHQRLVDLQRHRRHACRVSRSSRSRGPGPSGPTPHQSQFNALSFASKLKVFRSPPPPDPIWIFTI